MWMSYSPIISRSRLALLGSFFVCLAACQSTELNSLPESGSTLSRPSINSPKVSKTETRAEKPQPLLSPSSAEDDSEKRSTARASHPENSPEPDQSTQGANKSAEQAHPSGEAGHQTNEGSEEEILTATEMESSAEDRKSIIDYNQDNEMNNQIAPFKPEASQNEATQEEAKKHRWNLQR